MKTFRRSIFKNDQPDEDQKVRNNLIKDLYNLSSRDENKLSDELAYKINDLYNLSSWNENKLSDELANQMVENSAFYENYEQEMEKSSEK